ncbi:hypothetical protein SSX86_015011 [Deinandra increscens subsp. villosa]|uniref:Protein SirB1 N-terminal domain-containing protein n=1 Tax=Deinandra increscens subsp. villosa TaxID=3103831 RepID=A0AAP0H0M4_9ASTR
MLLASLSGVCCHQHMTCNSFYCPVSRSGFDRNVDEKSKILTDSTTSAAMNNRKKRRLSLSPMATAAPVKTGGFSSPKFYQEALTAARANFTQEISFQLKDKDISLAKTLLHISAEDEAFIAFNRAMDANSFQNEHEGSKLSSDGHDLNQRVSMPLAGKNIEDWLSELDAIAKEVEVELISRDIGCHLIEVLEAVNKVLFDSMGFKRSNIVDSKCSYLHSVLSSKCGSAILLSIIYIEVCRRLNLTIVGSRVGEDFLIWPQTGNPEELFKVTSGHSLFGIVNGRCVEDPKSKASDLNSSSLLGLDIATNRDIIGIYLANLIRLHWKRASRMNRGLMLTSPLRPVHDDKTDGSNVPLLRPQDLSQIWNLYYDTCILVGYLCIIHNKSLSPKSVGFLCLACCIFSYSTRLAIMASEKLLILQPHNWALRRDHGMMLYFTREYGEAVQELSICMAFAPEEEAEILEPFVEKLHLLRLESSWKSLGHKRSFDGSLKAHVVLFDSSF